MLIKCEKCSSEFNLPFTSLPNHADKIKCSVCGNIWSLSKAETVSPSHDVNRGTIAEAPRKTLSEEALRNIISQRAENQLLNKNASDQKNKEPLKGDFSFAKALKRDEKPSQQDATHAQNKNRFASVISRHHSENKQNSSKMANVDSTVKNEPLAETGFKRITQLLDTHKKLEANLNNYPQLQMLKYKNLKNSAIESKKASLNSEFPELERKEKDAPLFETQKTTSQITGETNAPAMELPELIEKNAIYQKQPKNGFKAGFRHFMILAALVAGFYFAQGLITTKIPQSESLFSAINERVDFFENRTISLYEELVAQG